MILQVDDFRSYDSVIAFHKYKKIFKENMLYSIHYKVFKNVQSNFSPSDCTSGPVKFCVQGTTNKRNLGLLQETVRQMCLYQNDWDEFIGYFTNIRNECFIGEEIKDDFKSCSKTVFEKTVSKRVQNEISECTNLQSEKAT